MWKKFPYNFVKARKSRIISYNGRAVGMDLIDRKLLELLQEDVTTPIAELATGVTRSQAPLGGPRKMGVGTTVFVAVKSNQHTQSWTEDFTRAVRDIPEVV